MHVSLEMEHLPNWNIYYSKLDGERVECVRFILVIQDVIYMMDLRSLSSDVLLFPCVSIVTLYSPL